IHALRSVGAPHDASWNSKSPPKVPLVVSRTGYAVARAGSQRRCVRMYSNAAAWSPGGGLPGGAGARACVGHPMIPPGKLIGPAAGGPQKSTVAHVAPGLPDASTTVD